MNLSESTWQKMNDMHLKAVLIIAIARDIKKIIGEAKLLNIKTVSLHCKCSVIMLFIFCCLKDKTNKYWIQFSIRFMMLYRFYCLRKNKNANTILQSQTQCKRQKVSPRRKIASPIVRTMHYVRKVREQQNNKYFLPLVTTRSDILCIWPMFKSINSGTA